MQRSGCNICRGIHTDGFVSPSSKSSTPIHVDRFVHLSRFDAADTRGQVTGDQIVVLFYNASLFRNGDDDNINFTSGVDGGKEVPNQGHQVVVRNITIVS